MLQSNQIVYCGFVVSLIVVQVNRLCATFVFVHKEIWRRDVPSSELTT